MCRHHVNTLFVNVSARRNSTILCMGSHDVRVVSVEEFSNKLWTTLLVFKIVRPRLFFFFSVWWYHIVKGGGATLEDFDLVILVGDTCLRVQCSGVHDRWVRPAQTVRYREGRCYRRTSHRRISSDLQVRLVFLNNRCSRQKPF